MVDAAVPGAHRPVMLEACVEGLAIRPEGVYVAAGHEGLGITTAPATGALIADLILGRTPPIDPAPYRPNRDFEVHHG